MGSSLAWRTSDVCSEPVWRKRAGASSSRGGRAERYPGTEYESRIVRLSSSNNQRKDIQMGVYAYIPCRR
jgi:hypothetical protein